MHSVFATRRLSAVVCSAALCSLLAACPFDKPEDYLARGKEQSAKQNHGAAAIEFKNYLQSNPRSAEVRFLLGRELMSLGDLRAAQIELQKAYDGRYDKDAVVPLLVQAQVMQGKSDEITEQIAKTELKSPQANAKLQSLFGIAAIANGRLDDALRLFRSAQVSDPTLAAARLGEARVDALRGNLADASVLVTAVLEKEPTNAEGLLLKGDIATAKNLAPEAIEAYLAAIKQNPRRIEARLNLTGVYLATNNLTAAQGQVEELKKMASRHPGVNYVDALISFSKKDYLHANDAIQLSLTENAANGPAQVLSGAIAYAMNQPAQSEVHLLEGIRLSPNSLFARRLLANLYLRQKQPQKAGDVLQPLLVALPDDPSLLGLSGEVAAQLGDYDAASRLFDRASKIEPTNADMRMRAGTADLAKGDEAGGFAALEAATRADGQNPRPFLALVVSRLTHRQFDEALVAWKDLQKLQPDSPVTYNLRAAIDLGHQDKAGARQALEHAVQLQANFFPAVSNLAALDEAEGNVDMARQRYRTLLDKDKTNTLGMMALAQLESRHGAKSEVVLPLLLEARRTSPNADQPVLTLVDYYLSTNNTSQALAVAQEASTRSPNNLKYLDLVGRIQMQRGAPDQALAAYRQLTSVKPAVLDYQIGLGQSMLLANQYDAATSVFLAASRKAPTAYAAQAAMVRSLLEFKRVDDAEKLLADIRKTSPKSPLLGELDGDVKMGAKQYAEAATAYQKGVAQTSSSALVIKQYLAIQGAGKGPEARAVLVDWLKAHPADVAVRRADADLALQANDLPRAAEGYRKVLDADPNDVSVMNNLAWTLWQQKDPQAMSYAEKAHGVAPNSPAVNDTLGWMLVEKGEVGKGLDLLQQALSVQPQAQAIALHVAKAQIRNGQKDAARSTLQALQKSSPGTAEAKESRALLATL